MSKPLLSCSLMAERLAQRHPSLQLATLNPVARKHRVWRAVRRLKLRPAFQLPPSAKQCRGGGAVMLFTVTHERAVLAELRREDAVRGKTGREEKRRKTALPARAKRSITKITTAAV